MGRKFEVVRAFERYRVGDIVEPIGLTRDGWKARGLIREIAEPPAPVVETAVVPEATIESAEGNSVEIELGIEPIASVETAEIAEPPAPARRGRQKHRS